MTDYVWCGKCQSYTPDVDVCPFCHKRKDDPRSLVDDYGPVAPKQRCMVRLEDGRSIHFHDDRHGTPYFCRESVYDGDPDDGEVVEDFYVIHDRDSLSDLLEDEPEDDDAEYGIAEGTVDVYGDDRTIRYTKDPVFISELNRKPRAVYRTPSSRVNRTGSLNRKPKKKGRKGRC